MESLTRRDREKQVREEEIISAAEKIFGQKDYGETSMDEIAREAQFTKRTLYQYFENKEDLYFAVVLKVFKRLYEFLVEHQSSKESGFGKIDLFCRNFYGFYQQSPEAVRIISMIGFVRKRSKADSNRLLEFLEYNNRMFQMVSEVIEEGKSDGTIQITLDSNKAALSLIYLVNGFLYQLSITGESFASNFSISMDEFVQFTISLLIGAFEKREENHNEER